MYHVLLSGGSGQRLWPLSNNLISKQYIKLIKKEREEDKDCCSMIQRVWAQLEASGMADKTIITANMGQVEIIHSQLGRVNIAVEPEKRDTFPAIALSCAYLVSCMGAGEEDAVVILPVDPYTEQGYFEAAKRLEEVLLSTRADIALMGVEPTYPSSKYGYILPEKNSQNPDKGVITVKGFHEKPSDEIARTLIENGALWNCGVFCFQIKYILNMLRNYGVPASYEGIVANYSSLPKISFDYEVLERAKKLVAISYAGLWKDLGTWNTLTEEMYDKNSGQIIWDTTSKNSHAINMLDIPMVIMGAENLVVAASHDGILIADKHQSSYLKNCLEGVEIQPKYEERAWGTIKTLDQIQSLEETVLAETGMDKRSEQVKTNKVKVASGKNTSYHLHRHHDEFITVISGEGTLILDGTLYELHRGSSHHIKQNLAHAVKAESNLRYIEILMGDLNADDVERFIFDWNLILERLEG